MKKRNKIVKFVRFINSNKSLYRKNVECVFPINSIISITVNEDYEKYTNIMFKKDSICYVINKPLSEVIHKIEKFIKDDLYITCDLLFLPIHDKNGLDNLS